MADYPDTQLFTKIRNGHVIITGFNAPSKYEWEMFFGDPKKASLFLKHNTPHVEAFISANSIKINTTKETFILNIDSILTFNEYEEIQLSLNKIKELAYKLKSI